jgi:hypothetical protein
MQKDDEANQAQVKELIEKTANSLDDPERRKTMLSYFPESSVTTLVGLNMQPGSEPVCVPGSALL